MSPPCPRRRRILPLLLPPLPPLLPTLCAANAATPDRSALTLYSYHLKPPFVLDEQARRGLYPELLPLLERHLGRPLRLQMLPRRRLLERLSQQRLDGAVLGVSPLWFDPSPLLRWTAPLLDDADLLLSRRSQPLSAAQLAGHHLALPRSYRVPTLQAEIDAGRLRVSEPDNEPSALAMLLHGRVDAAVLTRLTLQSLLRQNPHWRRELHVDPEPLGRFELGILVPPALLAEHGALSMAVRRLQRDPAWAALRRRHLGSGEDV